MVAAVLLGLAAAALVLATQGALARMVAWRAIAGERAASCVALSPPHGLDGDLIGGFRRATVLPASVRLKVTSVSHYGRCGTTQWAWAEVIVVKGQHLTLREAISLQDHSPIFEQRAEQEWENLGEGTLCGKGGLIPLGLQRAWRVSC